MLGRRRPADVLSAFAATAAAYSNTAVAGELAVLVGQP
jgi:hypothetical protein